MTSQETAGTSSVDYGGLVYDEAVPRTKCQMYLQEKLLGCKQSVTCCCEDVTSKNNPHLSPSELKQNDGQCVADEKLSKFGHNFRTSWQKNKKPKLEMNRDRTCVAGCCGDMCLKKQTQPNALTPDALMSSTFREPVLTKDICKCSTKRKCPCKKISGTLKRHLTLEHSDISYTSVKQPKVSKQKCSSNIVNSESYINNTSRCRTGSYQMNDVRLKEDTVKTEIIFEINTAISNNSVPKMELSGEEVQNVNSTPPTQGSERMCCWAGDTKQTLQLSQLHLKKPSDFYFQCLTLTCN